MRRKGQNEREDVKTEGEVGEKRCYVPSFEDGERVQRVYMASRSRKRQGNGVFPKGSKSNPVDPF